MPLRPEGEPSQGSPNEQHKRGDQTRLFEFIREQYRSPGLAVYFELVLSEAGLLSELEDAGVLPVVEDPNPYDPELEEEKSEQWWQEHPEVEEEFSRMFEKRDEVLRLLYVGALVGKSAEVTIPQPRTPDLSSSSDEK